jgi:hypothetical protein
MAGAALLLALLAVGRSLVRESPAHRARTFDVLAPQAAPLAHHAVGHDEAPVAGPDEGTRR